MSAGNYFDFLAAFFTAFLASSRLIVPVLADSLMVRRLLTFSEAARLFFAIVPSPVDGVDLFVAEALSHCI